MTKIEWTDQSWNPVTGCTKISPGCKNCYAARMAKRLAGRCGYPPAPHEFDVTMHPERLRAPLLWRKPRMVFVNSMSDLFHDDVPFEFIDKVFAIMRETPHTYQILTKRPERMRQYFDPEKERLSIFSIAWPLPNVWLGVSVENQAAADERIPWLLRTPAAVRFVSCEPLLGPLNIQGYLLDGWHKFAPKLHWVIAGCESGPRARTADADWFRSLRDQCQAAGVPFFLKQMKVDGKLVKLPELDGRQWKEFPG